MYLPVDHAAELCICFGGLCDWSAVCRCQSTESQQTLLLDRGVPRVLGSVASATLFGPPESCGGTDWCQGKNKPRVSVELACQFNRKTPCLSSLEWNPNFYSGNYLGCSRSTGRLGFTSIIWTLRRAAPARIHTSCLVIPRIDSIAFFLPHSSSRAILKATAAFSGAHRPRQRKPGLQFSGNWPQRIARSCQGRYGYSVRMRECFGKDRNRNRLVCCKYSHIDVSARIFGICGA